MKWCTCMADSRVQAEMLVYHANRLLHTCKHRGWADKTSHLAKKLLQLAKKAPFGSLKKRVQVNQKRMEGLQHFQVARWQAARKSPCSCAGRRSLCTTGDGACTSLHCNPQYPNSGGSGAVWFLCTCNIVCGPCESAC